MGNASKPKKLDLPVLLHVKIMMWSKHTDTVPNLVMALVSDTKSQVYMLSSQVRARWEQLLARGRRRLYVSNSRPRYGRWTIAIEDGAKLIHLVDEYYGTRTTSHAPWSKNW